MAAFFFFLFHIHTQSQMLQNILCKWLCLQFVLYTQYLVPDADTAEEGNINSQCIVLKDTTEV